MNSTFGAPRTPLEAYEQVLRDIDQLAFERDIRLEIEALPIAGEQEHGDEILSGLDLEEAISDLNAGVISDIREFERREGIKEGLGLVVNRISVRVQELEQ